MFRSNVCIWRLRFLIRRQSQTGYFFVNEEVHGCNETVYFWPKFSQCFLFLGVGALREKKKKRSHLFLYFDSAFSIISPSLCNSFSSALFSFLLEKHSKSEDKLLSPQTPLPLGVIFSHCHAFTIKKKIAHIYIGHSLNRNMSTISHKDNVDVPVNYQRSNFMDQDCILRIVADIVLLQCVKTQETNGSQKCMNGM